MSSKPFYITTTLPYVNSDPHIGFAMEIVRADVIARYNRTLGNDVFFNTGTDEHGSKIYENAKKSGVDVKEYVDGFSSKFKELTKILNISEVNFIRTTDEKHILAAQEMWKRCFDNGYIYKKLYQTKYCVGCELSKTDSELVDGRCPIHPNLEIQLIDEENYFFKFSEFQKPLIDFYNSHPHFVIPDFRFNEIRSFVERGLEDFSISRLKSKMSWGVPVPNDEDHVMYVWFDALTSYISTLGWPHGENFEKYWKGGTLIQYCGKDNIRQQSAMWQAMLMASGLPNSEHIVIDGFITSGGQKMSKSIGNVISPFDVIDMFKDVTDYPEDVLRFVLLHDISSFEDGDITIEGIKESYQAHLANGIGNLTSRVLKLVEDNEKDIHDIPDEWIYIGESERNLNNFDVKKAFDDVMYFVKTLDEKIQKEEVFKVIKIDREKGLQLLHSQLIVLRRIAKELSIFMPNTSNKILEAIDNKKKPEKPLFNRLQ